MPHVLISLLSSTLLPEHFCGKPLHNPSLLNDVRMERRSNLPQSHAQFLQRNRQSEDLVLCQSDSAIQRDQGLHVLLR